MAVATQEKGRGLKFAEQQLLRHGWEQGKGLGKKENGISEAIKVKVKCDKGGVGHKESEQFTFHWWDHVFNKASSSLAVESGQNGVVVKKMEGGEEEGMISNKKPRKAMLNKSALYGNFVKSATLLSGQEQPERRCSSSEDSSSSDDDDDKLDLSSTTKLSDDALMKACGGRTAHKGARHGLTMSAKLARLEQQEQEFLAKYGKKNQTTSNKSPSEDSSSSTEPSSALDQETVFTTKPKKSKKKKKQSTDELCVENCVQEDDSTEAPEIQCDQIPRKQKKCSKEKSTDTPDALDEESVNGKKKKKRKRSEKVAADGEIVNGACTMNEDSSENFQHCKETLETCMLTDDRDRKKEKRKKKKHHEKTLLEEGHIEDILVTSEDAQQNHGPGAVVLQPASDSVPKKKKKQSSEPKREDAPTTELETHIEEVETAAGERKKAKSKKRKPCTEEDQEEVENELQEKKKRKKKHEKQTQN